MPGKMYDYYTVYIQLDFLTPKTAIFCTHLFYK